MDYWNVTTTQGATIKTANDFTMTVTLNATDGDGPIWELYTSIAAVAAAYGDPEGKYAAFMANADNQYPVEPYFLFNQVSPTQTPSNSTHDLIVCYLELLRFWSGSGYTDRKWTFDALVES